MKIAVIGAGGVGGYFGGRLAQHGSDVAFIARGQHLQKIRSDGLTLLSPQGDATIKNIVATDHPGEIGPVDVVIVAVKGWQLQEALAQIKPLMTTGTMVLPLLNGINAPDFLADQLGTNQVLGGLCGIIAHIEKPGVIRHVSIDPFIVLGELDNQLSDRAQQLGNKIESAGIKTTASENIMLDIWKKFLFIAPISGVTSLARASIDRVMSTPQTCALLTAATAEVAALGKAVGMSLTEEHVKGVIATLRKTPAGGTTSMQRDIQGGRPSELETQTGAIVSLARSSNVDTPVNDFIYAALLPQEQAAKVNSPRKQPE